MNVVDFFCGCGGLSYGFTQAGFNVIVGIDNDKTALQTFEKNHKNSIGLNLDLSNINFNKELDKAVNGRTVNIIVGGPPCQGFSLTGTRNEKDIRNQLYKAMFLAARKYKPKVIIIENVPGIKALYKGQYFKAIENEFDKLDYDFKSDVLYAPDFGVPQIRKRQVFIAVKKDIGKAIFPEKVISNPSAYITCEQAISDLEKEKYNTGNEIISYTTKPKSKLQEKLRSGSKGIANHNVTNHTELVKSVIKQVPEGCNYKSLPRGVGESRKFHEAWTRFHSKKPSKTIDTGHRNQFHYKLDRVPTVRENARLQTFPDKFIFYGTKTQQYKQVGNAVPPMLGYHIALTVKKILQRGAK